MWRSHTNPATPTPHCCEPTRGSCRDYHVSGDCGRCQQSPTERTHSRRPPTAAEVCLLADSGQSRPAGVPCRTPRIKPACRPFSTESLPPAELSATGLSRPSSTRGRSPSPGRFHLQGRFHFHFHVSHHRRGRPRQHPEHGVPIVGSADTQLPNVGRIHRGQSTFQRRRRQPRRQATLPDHL